MIRINQVNCGIARLQKAFGHLVEAAVVKSCSCQYVFLEVSRIYRLFRLLVLL